MVMPLELLGLPTIDSCSLLDSTIRVIPRIISNLRTTASVGGLPDSADFMTLIVYAIRLAS